MIPLTSNYLDLSTIDRKELASQTPGGGLSSPAARPLPSQPLDLLVVRDSVAVPAAPAAAAGEASSESAPPSRWQRIRRGVWTPVLLRTGAACAGLLGLAVAGAVALRSGPPGVPLDEGTEWLAGDARGSRALPATASAEPPTLSSSTVPRDPAAHEPHDSGPPAPSPPPCSQQGKVETSQGQGLTADGRVVLNVATVEEFTRLPGVGPRRAEQIVALRERLGRFKRVTDLLRVKGIGPKSLRQLTPLVVLDPPPPPAAASEETSGAS